jgi:hypothetical protein
VVSERHGIAVRRAFLSFDGDGRLVGAWTEFEGAPNGVVLAAGAGAAIVGGFSGRGHRLSPTDIDGMQKLGIKSVDERARYVDIAARWCGAHWRHIQTCADELERTFAMSGDRVREVIAR